MIQPQLQATSVALKKVKDAPRKRERTPDVAWQSRAYDLASSEGGVGEVGYVFNLSANAGSMADLVVQQLITPEATPEQPNPVPEWQPTEDPRAARVLEAFTGPHGGIAELKRRALLHLLIGGESWLVGTPAETDTGLPAGILWEFLSTEEVKLDRSGSYSRRSDGASNTPLGEEVYVARMWRSDPRFSDRADSPMRRVLNIAAEIVVLTQMVDAIAKSRLSAGILYVPWEVSFLPEDDESTDTGDGEDIQGDDGIDEFTQVLLEHMKAPVEDRTSAAALVPLVMRGPAEMADKVKLIDIARKMDDWAQSLRTEAIHRLGAGLDIPPEIITGKGGINHWTGYNIDADFIIKHVVPPLELVADFITYAYMRPMLEEFESMAPEEAVTFRVAADPSALLQRADEQATARVLHDKALLSDDAFVATSGFDSGDMPAPDEWRRRKAEELIRINPGVFAKALLPLIPGFEGIDVDKLCACNPGGGQAGGTPGQAPPTPSTDVQAPAQGSGLSGLLDRIATASDSALERALERAGARVIRAAGNGRRNGNGAKATPDTTIKDRLATVKDQADVFGLLRADDLGALGLSTGVLFEGAWDRLDPKVTHWVTGELEARGHDTQVAHDRALLVAMTLREQLDLYVDVWLHRGFPRAGNGLRVPDELVLRALDAAGAAAG